MKKALPITYAPLAFVELYTPRDVLERQLENLARFVRRYAPNAQSVTLHAESQLDSSSEGYTLTYGLKGITAHLPENENVNLIAAVEERLEKGWSPPTEDPDGEYSWEHVIDGELFLGSLTHELLEPLVWAFANPFAYEPTVTVNLEDLERNLTAVEDVAAMRPGLAPCEGFYPALARNALFEFVRNHVPNARKIRVQYTLRTVEYDDALYLDYELTRIDVERRSGESVWLDGEIAYRAATDPSFAENAPHDPWTEALLERDTTGLHELLEPLVRGYAPDPNLKHGVIELEL